MGGLLSFCPPTSNFFMTKDPTAKLRRLIAELARALEDCRVLAAAWAGEYARRQFLKHGKVHPAHQEILKHARKALEKARRAGQK